MIQPGKHLFIIALLLFARISNAQQEYWPGMPRIHQENTFSHLGKFIIHETWMNQTYDGYYLSNDGGKTWRKLNQPLFSARNIFSITTLDSFFLIHAINGYYLTTDFVNYTFAGDPKHIEISRMVAANTVNKEIIGYKSTWLQAPQVTNSEQKVWFVSADGGFNWNVISGGLLTTRKSYVTGVAGEMPVYGDYYDVNMPSSFIGTKTEYLATYSHDFLPSNAKVDLVKFNFFSRQWETIKGTNYYTDVAKKDANAQLCHYNPKTESIFIYDGISKLFYSQNLGTNWLPCGNGLPTGIDYHALKLFSRADTLFAVVITKNGKYQYLPGLYYSLNNGMFFNPIPLNLPKGIELDGVTVSKEGYIVFTGEQCECAFIQESDSYNFNERAIPSTNKSPVTHLQVLNETEALAQSAQVDQGQETYGGISHTTDKGLTWTNVTRNLSNFGIKDWIFFHDTLLVLTPYARFTTDWGKTWEPLPGVDSMENF
ncbi:MAG: hypothetical protein IT247_04265 [Bacteroidia bacterium]|nr:hypothetical protein [Bacteroidia bacterium]